jgi:hypothetical protein
MSVIKFLVELLVKTTAGRTAFGRAVGRMGEKNGRVRPPSQVTRTGCEPMHMGMCIAESWGRQSLKRFFSSPPLYTVVVMHQKCATYAVQYTLLTLKPHAMDTRAPNVMKAVSTAWSHFVNVMSDNLRLHIGFLVALRY